MNNKKGSALVESLLALLTLSSVIPGFLTLYFYAALSLWIHVNGYEALICALSQPKEIPSCQKDAIQHIQKFWNPESITIHFQKTPIYLKVSILWEWHFIHFSKNLQLPHNYFLKLSRKRDLDLF
ncbi:MAG: hypothetical protein D6797_04240 [Bdellovibrio sp.]|nr:MAG: hypothetical protein D6797_04240 [Bdellovibrio sp.]